MAELVWTAKRRRRLPRKAPSIRTLEVHGAAGATAADPWRDRLVHGEAEQALPALLPELAGRVALVYVDPPFDTGGTFSFLVDVPGAREGTERLALPAYRDDRGLDAWLAWFHDVAEGLHDLLTEGGSLYVHLDAHVAHYAKVLLDEVFGPGAFQREIVWRIGWVSGFKSSAHNWIRNHDVILFYAKGGRASTFHKEYIEYPAGYVRRDGKPPKGKGYPIDDVWNGSGVDRLDSIQIMSFSGEKLGYPTQKNESLVARIVRASSNPGDIVLDAFVGSGTTAAVAAKLGRRWVACDASPLAIHVTRRRLLAKRPPSPFLIHRTGGASNDDVGHAGQRRLRVRAVAEGRRCTIELVAFRLEAKDKHAATQPRHWSHWIEGYCIDWHHDGVVLGADDSVWRVGDRAHLELAVSHEYDRSGRYRVAVKVFDVLGGTTTTELAVNIA